MSVDIVIPNGLLSLTKHKLTRHQYLPYDLPSTVTPAMEESIADHIWSVEELVSLLDARR